MHCKFKSLSSIAILLVLTLFINGRTSAQTPKNELNPKKLTMGVGLSGGIPTDKDYKPALGLDIRFQFPFDQKLSGMFTAGYTRLTSDVYNATIYYPLKAGLRYAPNPPFYIAAEAGVAIPVIASRPTDFIWAPAVGLNFQKVNLDLRYESLSGTVPTIGGSSPKPALIALRIGYTF